MQRGSWRERLGILAAWSALVGALLALLYPAASPAATVTEYPLAAGTGPSGITVGPDVRLWFTDSTSSQVGAIAPDGTLGGPFATFPASAKPTGIVRGPDGNLWYADNNANAIERISTAGSVTTFSLAALGANTGPLGIALGPNGLLYFTEANTGRIGRIDPLAGNNSAITASLIQTAVVPSGSGAGLAGIAPASDGNLWFTETVANRVATVSRDLSTITEFTSGISASSAPSGIAAGPDGALWFTERDGSRIGRITTGGAVAEFALPAAGRGPTAIALGPDAALWFTETAAGQIGRIDAVSHAVSEIPLAAGSSPQGIVAGPDGALWFTEFGRDRIGRLSSASPTPSGPTGKRAAALKKCKKKHSKRARRKCRKQAKLLPV
jgi:streptogramin lyase